MIRSSSGHPAVKGFFIRNWFVLSLPLAVALAWLLPDAGASGGWLRTEITSKLAVALIFLFQGVTLPTSAMRHGATQWRLHLLIQSFTFLLFPLFGIAMDAAVGRFFPADLRLGFLFLCVLPSTVSTSVVLTSMAGGNAVGAIFNAALSNVIGVFLTPLWVAYLMKASGQAQALGPIIREIVLLLLLPLLIGQLVRLAAHRWADHRKKLLGNFGSALILFLVFAAFCNSVKARLWEQQSAGVLLITVAVVAVVLTLALAAAQWLARSLGLSREDTIAATFCAPQKTIASGIPLAKAIFGAHPGLGLILLPIMFYHPLQLIVCGVLADRFAGKREQSKP